MVLKLAATLDITELGRVCGGVNVDIPIDKYYEEVQLLWRPLLSASGPKQTDLYSLPVDYRARTMETIGKSWIRYTYVVNPFYVPKELGNIGGIQITVSAIPMGKTAPSFISSSVIMGR
jgi:hypothetical protein